MKKRLQKRLLGHIESCPCCQKRLALTNRIELALTLIRTQPQTMELLARANASALKVLKHSLRDSQKSETLRAMRQGQPWINRFKPMLEQVLNVAACLFVLLMIRCGIFNSFKDYQNQGQTVLHNYYANNLDSQLMDEIFPDDTLTT